MSSQPPRSGCSCGSAALSGGLRDQREAGAQGLSTGNPSALGSGVDCSSLQTQAGLREGWSPCPVGGHPPGPARSQPGSSWSRVEADSQLNTRLLVCADVYVLTANGKGCRGSRCHDWPGAGVLVCPDPAPTRSACSPSRLLCPPLYHRLGPAVPALYGWCEDK